MKTTYAGSLTNPNGLSNQDIAQVYPSVFADHPHQSRSERYLYIPTSAILASLAQIGFIPTTVMQAKVRSENKERAGFTKHLLRLRHQDLLGYQQDEVPEIVIRNSHDGTSAYDLMTGYFRLICENGMIIGDVANSLKVTHRGHVDIIPEIVDSTLTLVDGFGEVVEKVEEMKQIDLSQQERLMLAEYAMKARFDLTEDEDANVVESIPAPKTALVPYTPQAFLRPRRYADNKSDLWTTMNVIQENAIKGRVRGLDARGKRHTTRAINGIDQQVRVNKLIWQFAEELRKIHA